MKLDIVYSKESYIAEQISRGLDLFNEPFIGKIEMEKYHFEVRVNSCFGSVEAVSATNVVTLLHLNAEHFDVVTALLLECQKRFQNKDYFVCSVFHESLRDWLVNLGFEVVGVLHDRPKGCTSYELKGPFSVVTSFIDYRVLDVKQKKKNESTKHSFAVIHNQIVYGGIVFEVEYDYIYISLLWLDNDIRHQGYGTHLMNAVEQYALKHDIHHISVKTTSFQALDFYKKMKYKPVVILENTYNGFTVYTLHKALT